MCPGRWVAQRHCLHQHREAHARCQDPDAPLPAMSCSVLCCCIMAATCGSGHGQLVKRAGRCVRWVLRLVSMHALLKQWGLLMAGMYVFFMYQVTGNTDCRWPPHACRLGVQNLASTSSLWALCADLFDADAAARLFGFIGAGWSWPCHQTMQLGCSPLPTVSTRNLNAQLCVLRGRQKHFPAPAEDGPAR